MIYYFGNKKKESLNNFVDGVFWTLSTLFHIYCIFNKTNKHLVACESMNV